MEAFERYPLPTMVELIELWPALDNTGKTVVAEFFRTRMETWQSAKSAMTHEQQFEFIGDMDEDLRARVEALRAVYGHRVRHYIPLAPPY